MSDFNPNERLWSIMTKSRGGVVSVIRDLTEHEAAKTYERLDTYYGLTKTILLTHKDFITAGMPSRSACVSGRALSNGDIEIREVFGPTGWTWFADGVIGVWPKFVTVWTNSEGEVLPDDYQDHPNEAQVQRMIRQHIARL